MGGANYRPVAMQTGVDSQALVQMPNNTNENSGLTFRQTTA
jgi:hypothetical protein